MAAGRHARAHVKINIPGAAKSRLSRALLSACVCVLAAAAVPARADPETGHGARRAYILKTSPHAAIVHATQNIQFEHQVETKWIFHAPQSGGFMPTSRPGDDSTIQSIKQQFKNQNENKNKLLTTNKLVGII